jgi:hypothetical protein
VGDLAAASYCLQNCWNIASIRVEGFVQSSLQPIFIHGAEGIVTGLPGDAMARSVSLMGELLPSTTSKPNQEKFVTSTPHSLRNATV